MVHNRRPVAWLMILMLMTISLTACGPDEKRETPRAAAMPASSRDAILNERLSALQNRIAQLDHQISQATVTSRQLNEELTALRQELAAGTAQAPVAAPATTASPQAVGTPVSAPPAPGQTVTQPVISQPAPPVPLTPLAPPPAPSSRNPMLWIVLIAIVVVAVYFIIKLAMGPWAEEEESDWIEEGGPADDEDKISLSPETSEKPDTESQEPGDEPKQ